MRAQDELKIYFLEIDRRTDLALRGVRKVRSTAKLRQLPGESVLTGTGAGFLVALAAFAGLFLN